ncbi:MAG: uroporphyrinogen decarboxylase family protein [Candidatus Riflebacteria bacterium]|nr:uroporphyrinogen decarboxylase family protein [Candidatus Riflebacteria bacterium]
MNVFERVFTTLGHKEPDRVPFFLLLSLHGAKELGLSIRDYFSNPDNVVEGQLRLRRKYRHDCYNGFWYAPLEVEAFGGEVIFVEDGPPNSGNPPIRDFAAIDLLRPPVIADHIKLQDVLQSISRLKEASGNDAPIIGVVMSPFSLPVMQLGFERYLDLMFDHPALFEKLIAVNQEFCINWANAQLAAGATAICYFDPVSSPTIIPKKRFLETGFRIARQTLAQFKGAAAIHLASGKTLAIIDEIVQSGAKVVGVSCKEDLGSLKRACAGRITILGNLNGIEMARWSAKEAETKVRDAIFTAAPGGGFILADNHGEIPWQVPDEVLLAISEAVHRFGTYPITR